MGVLRKAVKHIHDRLSNDFRIPQRSRLRGSRKVGVKSGQVFGKLIDVPILNLTFWQSIVEGGIEGELPHFNCKFKRFSVAIKPWCLRCPRDRYDLEVEGRCEPSIEPQFLKAGVVS